MGFVGAQRTFLYPEGDGYYKCIQESKYLDLDTLRVNFTAQWKRNALHMINSVPGSAGLERGRAVVSQVLLAPSPRTYTWPLKLLTLGCRSFQPWGWSCHLEQRETGK